MRAWAPWRALARTDTPASPLPNHAGTDVLAVQILRFADDRLWGRLSALGLVMIAISTALVVLANVIGARLRPDTA